MELDKLIASCKRNNRTSQGKLFERYKDILYLTSLKYCRNEMEAEDNLHDAFVTIFENIKRYKGKGSIEGWMKRITINKAIDKYKMGQTTRYEVHENVQDEEAVDWNAQAIPLDTILKSIQILPDQYRLVFNLYQLDGYSHQDISKMLGISEGTSRSNFFRARSILKEKLTTYHTTKKTTPSL